MKVLVVEDDQRMASLLVQGLTEEGYVVVAVHTGTEGYSIASTSPFDLIVLDVMLPGIDGFELARRLRKNRVLTPVLMLTARDTKEDMVQGLDLGADDYLTKPFDFEVFCARVRAAIRRGPATMEVVLRAGPLEVNTSSRGVKVLGRTVALSRTEYTLLELLVRRKGQVVSRETILEEVWGWDRSVESNTLDAFMRLLRSKIDHNAGYSLVQTVRGIGYRLDVRET
ncbi:MAG: response regulator transcription factor [Bryobacteraceae bacterium]|nr:response regulator transcription factor [Bryobacteraceae bacterium]